ncbi:sensor histidine kinase [Catenulispora subtropica]|uniref:histidine kinase n=1 Tax=Catenulispora subtropica TaxID=450798 RepID=A0ABN2SD70_9ACTN
MRNPHSHAQQFPAGRAARAVTTAALGSAAVTATLWSAGADAAALLFAEAGLCAAAAACRVWGRPAGRAPEAGGTSAPARTVRPATNGDARRGSPSLKSSSDTDPGSVPGSGADPGSGLSQSPASAPDPERDAAAAYVGIARRIQATVNQELADLRRMQDRHGDTPEVFGDLLRLDHGVSLIGRLADSLAVLGGAGPGRRRTRPVDLLDVVRGALSRIVEYPRVDVEVSADTAVAAAAVEPVVHALAELLDNATRYSPPDTRVRVGAERGPGEELVIVVEDAGVGLNAAGYRHACRVLAGAPGAGEDPIGPGGPTRLGLTVVGRLARSTGFEAALDRGRAGGTRATLRLPAALVTVPVHAEPPPEPAPRPVPRQAATWDPGAVGPGGLPQRRRHTTAPPNAGPVVSGPDTTSPETTVPGPGAGQWLGAFMGGKDGGRS